MEIIKTNNTSNNRIARYVSVALQGDVTPVVILTKSDLCDDVDRYVSEVQRISDKAYVHALSALYETGMEALDTYLVSGKTICFMGSSGDGKDNND